MPETEHPCLISETYLENMFSLSVMGSNIESRDQKLICHMKFCVSTAKRYAYINV